MLVEDHPDTRMMYGEFLRLEFEVGEAADGIAALQSIAERLPDIVVTDLFLPRMDGFDLIARMRADKRTAGIPVIALSGYSGLEHDDRIRSAGHIKVLLKPCMPDILVEVMTESLSRRAQEGSD